MTTVVEVAAIDEIPPGAMRGIDHAGQKYVVVNLDGTFLGIGGICSHAYAELENGYLAGDQLVCPLHASAFEVRTGAVVGPPADEPIPTFATTVRDGKVYLVLD
jgi:3-phenylpropionate/trans-cinnamate dioxygenase ferredoxin subunit